MKQQRHRSKTHARSSGTVAAQRQYSGSTSSAAGAPYLHDLHHRQRGPGQQRVWAGEEVDVVPAGSTVQAAVQLTNRTEANVQSWRGEQHGRRPGGRAQGRRLGHRKARRCLLPVAPGPPACLPRRTARIPASPTPACSPHRAVCMQLNLEPLLPCQLVPRQRGHADREAHACGQQSSASGRHTSRWRTGCCSLRGAAGGWSTGGRLEAGAAHSLPVWPRPCASRAPGRQAPARPTQPAGLLPDRQPLSSPLSPGPNSADSSLQYTTWAGSTLHGTTVCVAEQMVTPGFRAGVVVQFQPAAVRVVAASRAGVHTCGLVVPATLKSGWQPAAVKASARNRGTATGMKHGHGMQGPAAWAP